MVSLTKINLSIAAICISLILRTPLSHAYVPAATRTPPALSNPQQQQYLPISLRTTQAKLHVPTAKLSPLFADASSTETEELEVDTPEPEPTKEKTKIQKVLAMMKPQKSENLSTREMLQKMGLSVLLSYGWVSNMSYCVTVSLAWFGFTKKTGLSPLAKGQWKPFLAVYAGFYVFNNFIRPFRVALSVGVSKYLDNVIEFIQKKTNASKGLAIFLTVFLFNIVGTTSLMALGISFASFLSGVPVFPPKVVLP